MPENLAATPEFPSLLRREVAEILDDPQFQRSPVQSKLLQFLVEKTESGGSHISQFEVAVDGLGRDETADQLTESYPRVQISRLRKNLESYYSRRAPVDNLCVFIRHGDYLLRLAPVEKAYPGLLSATHKAAWATSAAHNDHVQASQDPAPPPFLPAAPATPPGEHGLAAAAPATLATPRSNSTARILAVLFLAAMVGVAAMFYAGVFQPANDTGALSGPPRIVVTAPAEDANKPHVKLGRQLAEDMLANSFLAQSQPGDPNRTADYEISVSEMLTSARPQAVRMVVNARGEQIYRAMIPIEADGSIEPWKMSAALVRVLNPDGEITRHLLAGLGDEVASDFECNLRVTTTLIPDAERIADTADCLAAYPDSPYRGTWHAREAFSQFRTDFLQNGRVETQGRAWSELQSALAAEPANPLANYVAAKVRFAHRECLAARPYVDQVISNGTFYPMLMATVIAEASVCPGAWPAGVDAERKLEQLIATETTPAQGTKFYMFMAAAALKRGDLSRTIGSTPAQPGLGDWTIANDALSDYFAGRTSREQALVPVEQLVRRLYWGDATSESLLQHTRDYELGPST